MPKSFLTRKHIKIWEKHFNIYRSFFAETLQLGGLTLGSNMIPGQVAHFLVSTEPPQVLIAFNGLELVKETNFLEPWGEFPMQFLMGYAWSMHKHLLKSSLHGQSWWTATTALPSTLLISFHGTNSSTQSFRFLILTWITTSNPTSCQKVYNRPQPQPLSEGCNRSDPLAFSMTSRLPSHPFPTFSCTVSFRSIPAELPSASTEQPGSSRRK